MLKKIKQIKNNFEENRLMKQADALSKFLQEQRQEKCNKFLSKYKNVMVNDELQIYVDKDEQLTMEAVRRGEKYWLWDTKDFISKLYHDAVEMCKVPPNYQFWALYVGVMAKFIEDEEVLGVFKRWYETGEIEYNKKFFKHNIYILAQRYCDHPITALFRAYSIETGQVPYPAYLIIDEICTTNPRYCINSGVYLKKISDDGLHLVECSKYDYNEAIGNHFANLTEEEQAEQRRLWEIEDDKFIKEYENGN